MTVSAIVLAAGEGSRMRSARPKPLHQICGRPMVMHVIHALAEVDVDRTIVVVGHGAERVTKKVQEQAPGWAHVTFVEQTVQRGTGDAAMVGMTAIPGDDLDDDSTIIILPGDTPLLRADTLRQLVATHLSSGNAATAITSVLEDPTGYGRVLRAPSKHGDGRLLQVVEQRDASLETLAIREVWTSMCAFRRDLLGPALRRLSPDNTQGEYYLTDVVEVLAGMGHQIGTVQAPEAETRGVNDRWQLALAERELRDNWASRTAKRNSVWRCNPKAGRSMAARKARSEVLGLGRRADVPLRGKAMRATVPDRGVDGALCILGRDLGQEDFVEVPGGGRRDDLPKARALDQPRVRAPQLLAHGRLQRCIVLLLRGPAPRA